MMTLSGRKYIAAALVVLLASAGTMSARGQEGAASVEDLGFKYESGQSRLEIALDRPVEFEKSVSESDKQVIIDIKGASISKKWARRIDASQHKSNIALISPYQSGDGVRVVLQLKDNGGVEVSQDGNRIVALIDNNQPDESAAPVAQDPGIPEEPEAVTSNEPATTTIELTGAGTDDSVAAMDGFFKAQQSKKYVGKKIFIQVADTELADVFRIISEASEFNIVLSEQVKGKVMLSLVDVPWDQALDIILQSYKLAAERIGNVLRITTVEALTKEREQALVARKIEEASEPMVVKIIPVSYAKIEDLVKIIQDFLSNSQSGSANAQAIPGVTTSANTNGERRGTIQIETRTNSLIVRDTPSNIEKIARVVKELDTPTPQVLIEAKFVEVSETKLNTISGRIFATSRELSSNGFSFNNARNNFGALFGGSGFTELDTGFAITPQPSGAAFGFQPKAALIPGIGEIGALLNILEAESTAKVIASPRIVTQNKEEATITQGQKVQLAAPVGANATGGFTGIDVTLSLSVTPQVTNDGSIILQVNFKQDKPAATSLAAGSLTTDSKSVNTTVMVDSGSTLVIGGVYTSTHNDSAEGIPILRELPIIGPLFGSKAKTISKGELFIFLTPRVINEKESGIRS